MKSIKLNWFRNNLFEIDNIFCWEMVDFRNSICLNEILICIYVGYINFLNSTKEYRKLYRTTGTITCETDRPVQLSWVKDGRNLTELGPVLWRSKNDPDAINGDILYANLTRKKTFTAIHFTSYGVDHDGYYECHAIDLETGISDHHRIHAQGEKGACGISCNYSIIFSLNNKDKSFNGNQCVYMCGSIFNFSLNTCWSEYDF